ncbi:hypothetical protein ACFVZL_36220 [Streptomyces sp. NPDC058320]|uniref:hypothetical protein n=1 Tax=unclassified Streptomyces TaxID=2593676 RepID=UPI0036347128
MSQPLDVTAHADRATQAPPEAPIVPRPEPAVRADAAPADPAPEIPGSSAGTTAPPQPRLPASPLPVPLHHDVLPPSRDEAPIGPVVQVHIGAIEIHGAASSDGPHPAPTPRPEPAADATAAVWTAGFDEFTGLRSYAPWER